jgi:hypothetical protein
LVLVELLIAVAAATVVVNLVTCIPDLGAVYSALELVLDPVVGAAALALRGVLEVVGIGVVDFGAFDFADEGLVVPIEIVDAGTSFECGLFGGINIGNTGAVSATLMNLINPQVVNSTITRVLPFSRGATGIANRVAVDLARFIDPVHILDTQTAVNPGVEELGVGELRAVELTACLANCELCEIVPRLALALLVVGCVACAFLYLLAVGDALAIHV